ncbi:hypothetical protein ACFVIY_35670 [Streptomyces sp. NPDC127166]|uniref:hypothetical protein n=1 Tax=Streptomyces sp. NPDC127166 TaxID=3345380 RepID=UPI00362973B4
MARRKHATALAIATVLAVGIAPAALGGASAFAATGPDAGPTARASTSTGAPDAGAAALASTGTVQQQGGPLVVASGEEGAVTTRVEVYVSQRIQGKVRARLLLPTQPNGAGDEDPAQYRPVTSSCAVNGGAFQDCPWDSPQNAAPLPDTDMAWKLTYDIRVDASHDAQYLGDVTATLEVLDENGNVTDRGPVAFRFVKGTPEAYLRTTVLARDKAGVLWQYPSGGRADQPLRARKRIGGGWNVYTAVASLNSRTAAGYGDLVALDRSGVLWYYEGSDNPDAPFKPRQKVATGWERYTALTSYGHGIVARDKDGVLWRFNVGGANAPVPLFESRTRIGGGWNVYDAIVAPPGGYDAAARDRAGVLWSYGAGYPVYKPRTRIGGGWNAYDALAWTGNLDGVSRDDLVARDKKGDLWLYQGAYDRDGSLLPTGTPRRIGWGWGIYDMIL